MEEKNLSFAREIFTAHGISEEPVRLSGGWTNSVFAAGNTVLRFTENISSCRLSREINLAKLLPRDTGYPQLLDSGVTNGHIWMLSQKIPGTNLEDAWENLTWDARAGALEQLWSRASHVHSLSPEIVRPHVNISLWYFTSVQNSLSEARALCERNIITLSQYSALTHRIRLFETAMASAPLVPVHGDLTPANAMWHDEKIAALMDFECAAIAPMEADLMMILDTAFHRRDLPKTVHDPAAESRFTFRINSLVHAENPNPDILHGYQAIKLLHHVFMDMDDDDFSEDHDELTTLKTLL